MVLLKLIENIYWFKAKKTDISSESRHTIWNCICTSWQFFILYSWSNKWNWKRILKFKLKLWHLSGWRFWFSCYRHQRHTHYSIWCISEMLDVNYSVISYYRNWILTFKSKDCNRNNFGNMLIEFCRNNNMIICNGRAGTDKGDGELICNLFLVWSTTA